MATKYGKPKSKLYYFLLSLALIIDLFLGYKCISLFFNYFINDNLTKGSLFQVIIYFNLFVFLFFFSFIFVIDAIKPIYFYRLSRMQIKKILDYEHYISITVLMLKGPLMAIEIIVSFIYYNDIITTYPAKFDNSFYSLNTQFIIYNGFFSIFCICSNLILWVRLNKNNQ
jgi:hypothetical protein